VAAFHKARAGGRLSRAAVETLAIIAYKQPLTRAQLEAIRGVSCGEVLRSLLERRLVEIKGRAEELGRPLLYGTGKPFLDAFGARSAQGPSHGERAAGWGGGTMRTIMRTTLAACGALLLAAIGIGAGAAGTGPA